jgi:hypothetical protein
VPVSVPCDGGEDIGERLGVIVDGCLEAAKGLPLSSVTETKKWSTAAGMLNTTAKTKRIEFSPPELNANRNVEKLFHVAHIELKN